MINRILGIFFLLLVLAVAGFTVYSYSSGYMEPFVFAIAMAGCGMCFAIVLLAVKELWHQS